MLRHALLGGALVALVSGVFLSMPNASASPVCVEGDFTHPVSQTIREMCAPYPLETGCQTHTFAFGTVLNGWLRACLPAPLVNEQGEPPPG